MDFVVTVIFKEPMFGTQKLIIKSERICFLDLPNDDEARNP